MRLKLLHSVQKHSIVWLRHHHAGAVIARHEAHRFEDLEAAIDLCNPLLYCSVLEVYPPEFLIARITLDVFDEGVDCFEAGFGDTRRSDLCV